MLKVITILKNLFLPSMAVSKAKVSALDLVLSKRGETTKTEVYFVLGLSILKCLFRLIVIASILFGWVDVWKLIKILTTSKIL